MYNNRDKSGYLTTVTTDGLKVGTVHSPDLCTALFYIWESTC